ncbi:MAG: hypothetical protein JRI90_18205 [Deltaproteobacteria bacterium]|nr:hypothetical protein [Deltaproteobacteria bacterium]
MQYVLDRAKGQGSVIKAEDTLKGHFPHCGVGVAEEDIRGQMHVIGDVELLGGAFSLTSVFEGRLFSLPVSNNTRAISSTYRPRKLIFFMKPSGIMYEVAASLKPKLR